MNVIGNEISLGSPMTTQFGMNFDLHKSNKLMSSKQIANLLKNDKLPQKIQIISFPIRVVIYIFIILLICNINALVDNIHHPEIPYFDEEHIIVGAVSGIVCVIFSVILELYFRHLNKAMNKIRMLESFLSICSYCKKIKIPNSDSEDKNSWKEVEYYIAERTPTKFSHGICPECMIKHFPEDLS